MSKNIFTIPKPDKDTCTIKTVESPKAIQNIEDGIKRTSPIKYNTTVYTLHGEEDFIDDIGNPIINDRHYTRQDKEYCEPAESLPHALAKISVGRSSQYYIKIEGDGTFVNPLGLYTAKNMNRIIERRRINRQKFVAVNRKCFHLYLKFLRTKQQKYLLQSQREI